VNEVLITDNVCSNPTYKHPKLPVFGNIYSMIMYNRRPRTFTFVPKAQSILLWTSGLVGESLGDLGRIGLCLGRKGTVTAVDVISKDHDVNAKTITSVL
jgi:hypothetical protein